MSPGASCRTGIVSAIADLRWDSVVALVAEDRQYRSAGRAMRSASTSSTLRAPMPPATPDPAPSRVHRPSAAVILVRGTGEGVQVYWVQRSTVVSYMPEFRAFIGGTVDPGDADVPVQGAFGPDATERACAFREAFEEAGVLIG